GTAVGNSINTATGQKLWVGMDHSNRGWSGNIDEVRVWSVVRTQNDIRNYMHLTLAGTETGLEAYYQFNESSGTSAGDKMYGYHLTMNGSAQFGTSTVDIGVGSMAATTLGSTGTSGVEVDLNNLQIDFADGSTLPNGELVIFRIEDSPANSPGDNYEGSEHWVVRNFGSNQTGLNVSALKLTLDPSDPILAYHTNTFKLYKRASGSDGAWTTMATEATSIDYVNGIICFEGLSGFTSFSQLMVGSTGLVLPVTLTRFEATRMDDTEVLIEWATSYEENCQLYAVEKSWDGKNFRAIEILDCENRGTQAVSYRHRDREAYAAYYRLRQVDEDQSYTLSDVRYVAGESPYRALEVYPNPSSGAVYLAVQNISAEQSIALRLIDLRGRELLVERGKLDVLTEGLNRSLDRIGPGIYFLQIDYGGQQLTQRLVRQ
ncbi:MAG: T9SS type A sorting domain-containing protein, partial [Bacteroidota bacterium]